jgi:hypothetical protein
VGLFTVPLLFITIKLSLATIFLTFIGGLFYFVIKFITFID